MADSGTYGPETLARRAKIAEQMWNEAGKRPVRHWAEGLANLADSAVAGLALNRVERDERAGNTATRGALASLMGGGAPAAPMPSAAPASPAGPTGGISDRIISAESGGDPLAKNPNSSATGPGQFIDSTWLETLKGARPDLAAGKDDAALLAMRSDPNLSKEMTDAYANQNRSALAAKGLPTTPGATYLAHFAGPGGAQKVLGADPKMQVAQLLSPEAMKANSFLTNMTAGDLTSWADKKMGGPPTQPSSAPAAPAAAATDPKAKIAAMLNNQNPFVQKLGAQLAQGYIQKNILGSEDTNDIKEQTRINAERKAAGLPPIGLLEYQKELKTAGKPETTINNTVNPILKGVGDRFNEGMDVARASIPQIQGIHEARKALDQGALTGAGADAKLFGAKVANLFGLGAEQAANTEVLRSSIGNSVLAKAKTLGANPSNADRDYIEKVVGGSIALEEGSIRRLLDMQEKWARDAIRRANVEGKKLLTSQPKELANIGGLLSVDEPEDYATFLKNNPITKGAPSPTGGGAVRKTVGGKNYIKRGDQWFEE